MHTKFKLYKIYTNYKNLRYLSSDIGLKVDGLTSKYTWLSTEKTKAVLLMTLYNEHEDQETKFLIAATIFFLFYSYFALNY